MYDGNSIWRRKGATLSDKSARQEFGLTQQEELPRTGESVTVAVSPFAPRKNATFAERKATLIDSPVPSRPGDSRWLTFRTIG